MSTHIPVAIVGGGQAGLSVSWYLKRLGIEHLIFEKHRIAHEWRNARWDSFCLVTPNWQCRLPGFPYAGDEPNGFMPKDEIVRYVEAFAASFQPPIREGVAVRRLYRDEHGRYALQTERGDYTADQVVIATGGYHKPAIPRLAERLPPSIMQLHSSNYRNPESLPEGAVLVVGTGQSGCQIAEDLHLAGRQVHLSVGGAPRSPRVYRGKDAIAWLEEMHYYDIPIDEHPQKDRVRHKTNHYLTGRDGGREIDLRRLALDGMQLYGRLDGFAGGRLHFEPDLAASLDNADAVAESIKHTIDQYIAEHGILAPDEPPYQPPWQPGEPITSLDLAGAGIRTVIWCIGFESDFSWVEVPVFDGRGEPAHRRGVTAAEGLYFIGLPWLWTWGSGRFSGVASDAAHLAEQIGSRQRHPGAPRPNENLNNLALGS
jgi:putative flavoprotein involved in K+ transport